MKKVTLFIDSDSYRVDGYSYKIYSSGEPVPAIPRFLINHKGQTTGILYVEPICIVTGYSTDLNYKTYNPETNTFI